LQGGCVDQQLADERQLPGVLRRCRRHEGQRKAQCAGDLFQIIASLRPVVPRGPAHSYAQMLADPQVRQRGLVQYASDTELGEVP
jgi:hypothetical protein